VAAGIVVVAVFVVAVFVVAVFVVHQPGKVSSLESMNVIKKTK
jgi:hypothetical protein